MKSKRKQQHNTEQKENKISKYREETLENIQNNLGKLQCITLVEVSVRKVGNVFSLENSSIVGIVSCLMRKTEEMFTKV